MLSQLTLSVCIATFERPQLLKLTLAALSTQERLPNEIVVSDASRNSSSSAVIAEFAAANPLLNVIYAPTSRRALPWQRWWAFRHSTGDILLFLDDDVQLTPCALRILEKTYLSLKQNTEKMIAGIGFVMLREDGSGFKRNRRSIRERWLRTSVWESGKVTPGGFAVSLADLESPFPVEVDWLWGGAMSYPRGIIENIGLLANLVALYDSGIGRSEDLVLSRSAAQFGQLYVITHPLALHAANKRRLGNATAYPIDGWRLGLMGTWGRAHTLRWVALDWTAYKRAWTKQVLLEGARALSSLLKHPFRLSPWGRFGGMLCGIALTIVKWRRIPDRPA